MRALVFISILFSFSFAHATKMKSIKSKGRKAIVQFSEPMDLQRGDILQVEVH